MSSNSELARSHRHLNVHPLERLISIGIGACMMQSGLQRSGVGGALRLLAGGALAYRGLRGHCPLYEAYDIDTRSGHSTEMSREWQSIEASVLVSRPPNELYRTWRDFTRMPSLLSHVEKVEILDDQRSRWTVIGPMNARLDLVSRVDDDQQDRRIAWRRTPQASVETEGAVEFLPEGAGATRVKVHLSYRPPGGSIGRVVGRIFGPDAQRRLEEDLSRFKHRLDMEGDGQAAHPGTGGSPTGSRSTAGQSAFGPSGPSPNKAG